jgi:hypothetical protein
MHTGSYDVILNQRQASKSRRQRKGYYWYKSSYITYNISPTLQPKKIRLSHVSFHRSMHPCILAFPSPSSSPSHPFPFVPISILQISPPFLPSIKYMFQHDLQHRQFFAAPLSGGNCPLSRSFPFYPPPFPLASRALNLYSSSWNKVVKCGASSLFSVNTSNRRGMTGLNRRSFQPPGSSHSPSSSFASPAPVVPLALGFF